MTVRGQWVAVAAVVAVLAVAGFAASRLFGDGLAQVNIGSKAPDFHAATLDAPATIKSMANYKGDVILLNIWATWCGPCREEMPSIEALHQAMKDKGLRIVAVSIDQPGMEQDIRGFAKELHLNFEILHDSTGVIQTDYQTTGVPQTFVIARDGTIRKKWIGAADWNSEGNRRLLAQLLSESR